MELYIHIPFCVKKCRYCDFLSFAGKEACFRDYIEALCAELDSYRTLIRERGLDTIFIGGGTPSILHVSLMVQLLERVDSLIAESGAKPREYTIECNPGTLDREKLRLYKKHGINRLSIGLQSANDAELKLLGRIHDYDCFLDNYRFAREEGFDNINIDLISALPGQTAASWERTLRTVAELNPEHISAYSLIIEPGTPFYEIYGEDSENAKFRNQSGTVDSGDGAGSIPPLPDEDEERRIYRMTSDILSEYGYGRYEISNYSKPGFESKHNLGYWTGADYIGAGLGASSYLCERGADGRLKNAVRFKNTGDLSIYLAGKQDRTEEEKLTGRDLIGEYVMLHLRLTKGFSEDEFVQLFGQPADELFGDIIKKYVDMGLMKKTDGYIRLTESGLDVSNSIMAEFI